MDYVNIIIGICGIIIGVFLGFIADRNLIKYQEYKSTAKKVRYKFIELRKIIKENKDNFNFSNHDCISDHISETSLMIDKLLSSSGCIKKRRIKKKYNKFINPLSKDIDESLKKYSLNIYDFLESEFKEHFPKLKALTGSQLAIIHLDELIKIIK